MEVEVPVQGFHFHSQTKTTYMSSTHITEDKDDDFAFNFSGHLHKNSPPPELTTADELFYKGKIRTLKHSDPFSASIAEPTRDSRSRSKVPSLSSRSRKGSRSLSPLRKETISCKTEEESSNSGKKWCFKDLLLFRSASEGRATGDKNKDPLRKYTAACVSTKGRKGSEGDESRSSSFRLASPHAMHYAANRAAAEELKRKTALPYKQSFLNWLRFAPALRSFGSSGAMAGSKSMPRLRDGN